MIGLLLAAAIQSAPLPVVTTSPPAAVAPSPAPEAPVGTLVGCLFLNGLANEARSSFSGVAIFLPKGIGAQAVKADMISDPGGLLGSHGFARVDMAGGVFRFTGRNSLELRHKGGGIYSADLETHSRWKPAQPGACQVGDFARREEAFGFFAELLAGMNSPEAGDQ